MSGLVSFTMPCRAGGGFATLGGYTVLVQWLVKKINGEIAPHIGPKSNLYKELPRSDPGDKSGLASLSLRTF